MNPVHFHTVENDSCGCCVTSGSRASHSGEPYGCAEKKAIFTGREQRVLKSIRETAVRARELKSRLNQRENNDPENERAKRRALQELEKLRELRRELEKERVAAAHERMVLLGHA